MVSQGMSRAADDIEMHCAATGIQARIVMAQGDVAAGSDMLKNRLETLPAKTSPRLRQNLKCAWLTMELMQGRTADALAWLASEAPDETREFIILDRYRYMLKLRLYIITGNWTKTRLLVNRLSDYFERYQRPYMRVQLYMLEALIDRRTAKAAWKEKLIAALSLARRYKLARVIADEGIAVLDMLTESKLPEGLWEQGVLALTRTQAAACPGYMRSIARRPTLSDREYQVYSLMIAGYKNAKIASILNISERTVKYFCGLIYQKLGVSTRAEAMNKAAELGDIK
jgi:LuxR family maltose regulon positive regulatory protein